MNASGPNAPGPGADRPVPEHLRQPGESRSEYRDRQRTYRVAEAALRSAGDVPAVAASNLRAEARAALQGAVEALDAGAGDERVRQLMEHADRRLRAAADLGRRERGSGA